MSSAHRPALSVGPDLRAALRALAEALPPNAAVPVPRETLLDLLDASDHQESPGAPSPRQPVADRFLGAREAADVLGVAPRWLYRHADTLPFARRLSRKALRFSEAGLRKWVEHRTTGGRHS